MVRRLVLVIALVAGVLVPGAAARAAGTCPAPTASARVDRIDGADRYSTAVCASRAAFPTATGGTVLIARGDDAGGWADALAGTVLARARQAPILLTAPTTLPDVTRAELQRLDPRVVRILGGSTAVSPEVRTSIKAAVPDAAVSRIAGATRFETAVKVSNAAGAHDLAFVVNGRLPSDALLAGPIAARRGAALLLSEADSLPSVTANALARYSRVVIVGNYANLGKRPEQQIIAIVGRRNVRRVSGATRQETAASVARAFGARDGRLYLVNGADGHLVDAVSASWSAALKPRAFVLFSERDAPGRATDRYLRLGGLRAGPPIRLVGGTGALSTTLVQVLQRRYNEAAAGGPRPEMRGVWVHLFDSSLKSRPGIEKVLDAAAAANLNTVIVEVVRRQDSYYQSQILPRTVDPGMPDGLDLLGHLLPAAHDRGLKVHAWVPALPAYHEVYGGEPLPSNHVWVAHGPNSSQPWVSRTVGGQWGAFLDPGVPAVQDHVVSIFRQIARRYPVDAVHIDYLRYESNQWGYHPTSLARFRNATGRTDTPGPADPQWGAWRRAQTRAVAVRVTNAVHAVRPSAAVTLAGSSMGASPASTTDYSNTHTWKDVFQPWPAWLKAGHIDAVFPMNYFREADAQQRAWYDGWVAFEQRLRNDCRSRRTRGCGGAVGQASYLNSVNESVAQISQARQMTDGAVMYSYQQDVATTPYGALRAALARGLYAAPAPAPRLR